MKLLFIFLLFVIISCNSDKDSSYSIKNDLILGRWQYVTAYIDDYEEPAKNCSDIIIFDTLQIRKDYTFTENDSNECLAYDTIQFHWQRISQDMYRFKKNGHTSSISNKVFFKNSNNTLLLKVAVDTTFVYNRIK